VVPVGVVIRVAVSTVAAIVIVGCLALLAVILAAEDRVERYTSGTPPVQFYRELDASLLDDYSLVYGVAHNSGNSLSTVRAAVRASADIVEIDVVMTGGKLYAGHDSPLPFIGKWLYRGPQLAEIWNEAAAVPVTKLDLKETSPSYLESVARFLESNDDGRAVAISSRSPEVLMFFEARVPHATRLLSIGDEATFERLRAGGTVLYAIDGVTVRHTLLDEARMSWLKETGMVVLAWTVNDAARMNELVHLGVDAITSDNLAILELLGGQERGGDVFVRR
jgi:glycerophosphoryl diester phosphodiesterase